MQAITEFARAFGVTRNTIRRWTADFAEFLSPGANPPQGKKRLYTEEDAAVLSLVYQLRNQYKETAEIAAALAAGDRSEWPPKGAEMPQEEQKRPEDSTALVTQIMGNLARFEGQLTAVSEERDHLRQRVQEEQTARLDAEKRAAAAETEARMLRAQLDQVQELPRPAAAPLPPETAVSAWARFWARVTGKELPEA